MNSEFLPPSYMVKFPKMLIDLFSKHLLSILDTIPAVRHIAVSKTVKNPCAPEVYILMKRDRDQKQTKTMHILAGLVEKRQQG